LKSRHVAIIGGGLSGALQAINLLRHQGPPATLIERRAETARGGEPTQTLRALGPMTRGTFWEIVAVPDIRRQTWAVVRKLSNAHWVGGEGL
jgi:uncharacterized NAD(P)/FAD-binding protein YdhS